MEIYRLGLKIIKMISRKFSKRIGIFLISASMVFLVNINTVYAIPKYPAPLPDSSGNCSSGWVLNYYGECQQRGHQETGKEIGGTGILGYITSTPTIFGIFGILLVLLTYKFLNKKNE